MVDGAEGFVESVFKAIGFVVIVWPIAAIVAYKLTKEIFPKGVTFVMSVVILGPPLWVSMEMKDEFDERQKNQAAVKKASEDHRNHFASVCNTRTINVVAKVQSEVPRGVLIELDPDFPHHYWVEILGEHFLPKVPGIAFFEQKDTEYIPSENRYRKFFIRIDRENLSRRGQPQSQTTEPSSQYVLEGGRKEPSDGGWTNKTTIKLLERSTRRIFASMDIYLFSNPFEQMPDRFGCPNLRTEITKMLNAVFD